MKIDYTCKFCRKPGYVILDDDETIMFQVSKWKPLLSCNRCADYHASKRKITDRILRASNALCVVRSTSEGQTRLSAENKLKEALVAITKRFSQEVCNYYLKTTVWEPEFADQIFEHPDRTLDICAMYVRGIKTIV